MRESFFVNQLGYEYTVSYAKTGDFLVDNRYTFEVGGKGKSSYLSLFVPLSVRQCKLGLLFYKAFFYIVIYTSNWRPWSKKVILLFNW